MARLSLKTAKLYPLKSPIISQKEVLPKYFRLSFFSPKIVRVAQPGQFVHIHCGGGTYLRRPFSIAGVKRNQIEIVYKVVGKGTELLSHRKKGETLDVIGPLGSGFSLQPVTCNLQPLLIAGGTGIASLLFLAQHLSTYQPRGEPKALLRGQPINLPARRSVSGGGSTVVLIGAKTKNDLLSVNDFKKLGCQVKLATEDGSLGFRGLVSDLFKSYLVPRAYSLTPVVFACGPYQMLKKIAEICRGKQIKCQVSLENIMACGIGACRGCVVKTRITADKGQTRIAADKFIYKTVCKDGPVFNVNEIIWE